MSEPVRLLDHGSIELVESWGSDEAIVAAARQSTQGGFISWEPYEGHPNGDVGLLRYLARKRHTSPFEFAGAVVQVEAPIFVLREWMRHRTWSYSEASARYAPLPATDYLPTAERCLAVGGDHLQRNKQAGPADGAAALDRLTAEEWLEDLRRLQSRAQAVYERGLAWGVPKELARLALTVGRYSRMRAAANLWNLSRFVRLRAAPDAQREIRIFAEALSAMLAERFPRSWPLLAEEGRAG